MTLHFYLLARSFHDELLLAITASKSPMLAKRHYHFHDIIFAQLPHDFAFIAAVYFSNTRQGGSRRVTFTSRAKYT